MKNLKKGYTLVEIMLCLGALITILTGAFTLLGKYNLSFVTQTERNNYIYNENSVFLELTSKFSESTNIQFIDDVVYFGNNILTHTDNSLYLNGKQVLVNEDGVSVYKNGNCIYINIGGNTWCFSGLNAEM